MAAPTLRLRRGSGAPSGSIAVVAEPFFDTGGNLYVATGTSTFSHIGGSTYTARVDNFLTDAVANTSPAILTLKDQDGTTPGSVSLDAPAEVTTDYTLTLPAALPGSAGNYFLQIDQSSGNMSFVAAGSGAASQVSTVTNETDASFFLTFVDSNNGTAADESVYTDAGVSYNPSTNLLTVTGEVDAGSIDVGATGIDIAGATSGTVTLTAPATAGTTSIVFPATNGTVVTTGDSGTVTSAMIANSTIVNGDISGSAAIDFSKLAALTGGNILVGNASNVATSVAASGDVSISNTGAFSVTSVQNNAVALGTGTSGQYASTITGGSGIAATTANADDGTAYTVDLDITGLSVDAIADADELAFYDTVDATNGAGHNKITAANLALYVLQEASGDVTFDGSGSATIANDSVALGTQTTGDYVAAVTTAADSGLVGGNAANEGTTSALALKNVSNLADTTVLKWDDGNGQLANSSITDDGTTVTVTANLNVQGTTTTVNTTSVLIEDPLQELGLENSGGSLVAPTTSTGAVDRGLKLHYHDGAAKEAYMIFDASTQRMVFAVDGADSNNTVTVDDANYATIHAKGLYVTHENDAGLAAVGNVITIAALGEDETEAEGLFGVGNGVAGVYLLNTTIDCGSY